MTKPRVFLSFDSDDLPQIRGLRLLASNPNYDLEFYDESLKEPIDSQRAEYIKQVIREKIKRASITLCLVGNNTYKSKWVDWELRESEKQGNAIIAMALKGIERVVPPSFLKEGNITIWKWDPQYLQTLINNASKR